jgi:hypothetical protein
MPQLSSVTISVHIVAKEVVLRHTAIQQSNIGVSVGIFKSEVAPIELTPLQQSLASVNIGITPTLIIKLEPLQQSTATVTVNIVRTLI